MTIGVITAMSAEHQAIKALLTQRVEHKSEIFNYVEGQIGRNRIILMQSGIGKVNAAVGCVDMIRTFSPSAILSSGVAGGIDSSLSVMDIVVSAQVVYHDVWCGEGNDYGQVQGLPTYFCGDKRLCEVASKITSKIASQSTVHVGMICSGDKFITNRAELDTIKSTFPSALAVDMESGAIAQVCHLYNTPFVSFRIISDTPGATEDHAAQYADFWSTMADRSFEATHQLLISLPDNL